MQPLSDMRMLVTGVASLVGSHLADRLLEEGHEVVGLDDFSRGSYANVSHLAHEPRFLFVEHDVAEPFAADVDEVFHLAVPSSDVRWAEDAVGCAMTCVAGTKNVLALGKPLVVATAADLAVDALACVERMLAAADARFVRIANPYGPRMAPDDPVGRVVVAALRGEDEEPPPSRVTWVHDAVGTLLAARVAQRGAVLVAPSREADRSVIVEIASQPDAPPASLRVPMHLREGMRRTISWFEERVSHARARNEPRSSGVFVKDGVKNPARRSA